MNFIVIGIKEIGRRLRRQKHRLALSSARQALAEAEIALGRYGWRYLTDHEGLPEPLTGLRKLDAEIQQQAAQIAELETKIRAQEVEKERARQTYQAIQEEVEQKKRPLLKLERNFRAQIEEQQAMLNKNRKTDPAATSSQTQAFVSQQLEAIADQLQKIRREIDHLDSLLTKGRVEFVEKDRSISQTMATLNREMAVCRRGSRQIEEQKRKGYQLAGQILAGRSHAPPAGEEFYENVQLQAQVVLAMNELESDSVRESREVNRQDLRTFYFVLFTIAFILGLTLLLIFRSPAKREYLPANTEAIISLNSDQFQMQRGDTAFDATSQPDLWRNLWNAMMQDIKQVPELNPRYVVRITRAITHLHQTDNPPITAEPTDYLIAELKSNKVADSLIRKFSLRDSPYRYEYINGLAMYEKSPQLAVARIGPRSITVNDVSAVKEMIRVRLGLSPDLNVDNDFLNHFQRLGSDSTLRLITSEPRRLTRVTPSLFDPSLLEECDYLGLAIKLQAQQSPSIFVLLKASTPKRAKQIAESLKKNPEKALGLEFASTPDVELQEERSVEWRFQLTPNALREFLLRISKLGLVAEPSPTPIPSPTPTSPEP